MIRVGIFPVLILLALSTPAIAQVAHVEGEPPSPFLSGTVIS